MKALARRVLVANLSAPELRYLAAELARRSSLHVYVGRYANQQRAWERLIARLPALGTTYLRTLGRRAMPEGLTPASVQEAGTALDFAAALIARIGLPGRLGTDCVVELQRRVAAAIGARARGLCAEADAIVAGAGTAWSAFSASSDGRRARILNYPSAHHRFQRRFFAAHAELQPEFAALCEYWTAPTARESAELDAECASADVILTGSDFARRSFVEERVDAARVRAIPYGVDLRRFVPEPGVRARRPFRVLFVGRISSRKGIGYLLHAYRRFRRPDTELLLVGDIAGDARCLEPYRDLFVHRPSVAQHELPAIYRSADVFIFPSLLEGLGLVVLEAMACGRPVIVSRNGPGDVVRDGIDGLVVPAADAEAIERALELVYRDPDRRQEMGIAARAQAEAHGWEAYAARAADAVLAAAPMQRAAATGGVA